MKEILEYIDFEGICSDNDLIHGDITPSQVWRLESVLENFISQNK